MSYTVYIIYSLKLDKYYIGYSEDVSVRLEQHNSGISTFLSQPGLCPSQDPATLASGS